MQHSDEQYEDMEELEAEPQKPAYSKVIVAACLVFVLTFTVACMVFYWNTKSVDPVLIGFFFACFGMEFVSLAFIKGREIKYVGGDAGNKRMAHVELGEDKDE